MRECVIRGVEESDLPEVIRVEFWSFPYPFENEVLALLYIAWRRYFFVAECFGQVVGYVAGRSEGGWGHVVSIAVMPRWRGKGLGKALMLALEEAFVADGLINSYLEVAVWNRGAIALYKRLGYVIAGIVRNYYPDGSDAYVMVKRLITYR